MGFLMFFDRTLSRPCHNRVDLKLTSWPPVLPLTDACSGNPSVWLDFVAAMSLGYETIKNSRNVLAAEWTVGCGDVGAVCWLRDVEALAIVFPAFSKPVAYAIAGLDITKIVGAVSHSRGSMCVALHSVKLSCFKFTCLTWGKLQKKKPIYSCFPCITPNLIIPFPETCGCFINVGSHIAGWFWMENPSLKWMIF